MSAAPPVVVIFTGLPGVGKSTLSDRVARTLVAPCFSGDWLLGALAPTGLLDDLGRDRVMDVYYRLLFTLVSRQVRLGQSAVVDWLVTDEVVVEWQAQLSAPVALVECVCSDPVLHRTRVESRQRHIPGWHEIDWAHVERMRADFAPSRLARLTVDAVAPLEQNVQAVQVYLDDVVRASR